MFSIFQQAENRASDSERTVSRLQKDVERLEGSIAFFSIWLQTIS